MLSGQQLASICFSAAWEPYQTGVELNFFLFLIHIVALFGKVKLPSGGPDPIFRSSWEMPVPVPLKPCCLKAELDLSLYSRVNTATSPPHTGFYACQWVLWPGLAFPEPTTPTHSPHTYQQLSCHVLPPAPALTLRSRIFSLAR